MDYVSASVRHAIYTRRFGHKYLVRPNSESRIPVEQWQVVRIHKGRLWTECRNDLISLQSLRSILVHHAKWKAGTWGRDHQGLNGTALA